MGIGIAYDMKLGDVTLKNSSLEVLAKWFDGQHEEFGQKAILVHRKTMFEILIKIIKLCPVDTGRLRASFLPFMDKYGAGNRGAKVMQDASSANYPRETPKKGYDAAQVERGKTEGQFIDEALATTIASNVVYSMSVEKRVGFLGRALIWGQKRYNDNFERFFAAAVRQGMIPSDKDETVDPNSGGSS